MTNLALKVDAEITPRQMAEVFWKMNSSEQAEFFQELYNVTAEKRFQRDCQWFYLAEALDGEKQRPARETLMSMAAPLFLNVLRGTEWGSD